MLKKIIHILLFILIAPINLYSSPEETFEKGIFYSNLAYMNAASSIQYEKALLYIDRAISELEAGNIDNRTPEYEKKLGEWKNSRESIQRFYDLSKNQTRNKYPLLHHYKTAALYFDRSKENELIAIKNITAELEKNIKSYPLLRPVFITITSDSNINPGTREEAFHFLENSQIFKMKGQFHLTIADSVNLSKTLIDIFKTMAKDGDFNSLFILHISGKREINGFTQLTGTIYRVTAGGVENITDAASFGYNTSPIDIKLDLRLILSISVSLLFLTITIFYIFKKSRNTTRDSFKQITLAVIVFIIGLASLFILTIFDYQIFTPINIPGNKYKFLIEGIFVFFILFMAFIALFIVKFEGNVVLVHNRSYLPVLFGALTMGMSNLMFYNQQLFSYIYCPENVNETLLLVPLFFISGFNTGYASKWLYKILLSRNESFNSGKDRSFYIIPVIVCLILAQTCILAFSFENYLAGITHYYRYLLYYSATICILFSLPNVLLSKFLKRKGDQDDQSAGTDDLNKEFKIPLTIDDLKDSVKRPLFIKPEEFNKAKEKFDKCLDEEMEGGILYLHGEKYSGKKRYADELGRQYPDALRIPIICNEDADEKSGNEYRCFLEGLEKFDSSVVKTIKAAHQMSRLVDNKTKNLANPLSMIPFAGSFLRWFFQSDFSSITRSSDSRILLKKLSSEMLKISKSLMIENAPGSDRPKLIFIIYDFQNIDNESIYLIKEFIKLLNDVRYSPEKNPVGFIICGHEKPVGDRVNSKYEILKRSLKEIDAGAPQENVIKRIYEHEISGLPVNDVRELILYNLNFAPDAADVIIKILENEYPGSNTFKPGDVLDIIEMLIEEGNLEETQNGFNFTKTEPVSVNSTVIKLLEKKYTDLYRSMSFEERLIVSNAAVIGEEFELDTICACVSCLSESEMVNYLYDIENTYNIIKETGDERYKFRESLIREIFHNAILKNSEKKYNQIFFTASKAAFNHYSKKIENTGSCNKHNYSWHAVFSKIPFDKKIKPVFDSISDYITEKKFENASKQLNFFLPSKSSMSSIEYNSSALELFKEKRLLYILRELVINKQEILREPWVKDIINKIFERQDIFSKDNLPDFASLSFHLSGITDFKEIWTARFCEDICEKLKQSKSINDQCNGHFWLANIFKKEKDYINAELEISETEKCYTELNDDDLLKNKEFESRIYNAKGEILYGFENHDKAEQAIVYFKKSIDLKEDLNDSTGLAMSYGAMAEIYKFQGKKSEALKNAEISYEYNKKKNNTFGIYLTSEQLAELYKDKSGEKSLSYYREAVKYCYDDKKKIELIKNANDLIKTKENEIPDELRKFFNSQKTS